MLDIAPWGKNEHKNKATSNSNWGLQGSHCIFTTPKYNYQIRLLYLAHQQQLMLTYIKTYTYTPISIGKCDDYHF